MNKPHASSRKSFPTYRVLLVAWAVLGLLLGGSAQKIPPKPNPPKLVNDFSGLLTPDQRQHLEDKLVAFDDSTSVQLALVIVPSLGDYEASDYAFKLGREWGVGNKKTNNGVVFLVSTEEGRRRVFIAPGYGLEGALPDITCKQIVENNIIPQVKAGNYYGGMNAGVDAIIAAAKGEYKAPAGYRDRGQGGGSSIVVFLVILLIVVFILGAGSRGGGPKGGMFSRRGYRDFMGPVIFFPGGGGGRSSGGGWSGGGGGFGGFGGGSFGGGGAGGSW
jgi:uncharacterized protein